LPETVLAIDPATRSGFAHGAVGGKPVLESVNFGRERDSHADIFGRATKWFARLLAQKRFDLVVIEEALPPSEIWGRTYYGVTAISHGLRGIFLGQSAAYGLRTAEAPIRSWRKYSLGRGDLARDDAKAAAVALCKNLRWPAADDNAAEAAGIWLYGCSLLAPARVQRHEPLFLAGDAG
jgi:hypothetical protein